MNKSLNIVQNNFKELPNNIEAEQSVIGSILTQNEIFDEITSIISDKNFFDPLHQKIFESIQNLIYKGLLANPITLKNYFENEDNDLNVPEYLIKITKLIFGKFIKDPSNKDKKFLRTKVRNLKKPLEKSGIKYEQIFKSIKNLSSSKETLDRYFNNIFKKMIKKKRNEIKIDLKKYNNLSKDIKIAIINVSIKQLKENYYDLRSKKIEKLIKNLKEDDFKKYTLGGCIFFKKGENLCLIPEKS